MRAGLNKIQRCPWCGNFLIQLAIKNAIKELNIDKKDLVVVSGIGCSGKMSQYIDWYWAETLHGRSVPFAVWLKLANPKLTVIAYGWDWDGYGIWLGHLLHAARRDVDITYIVADNENYALTTGQASPTTPLNIPTKSTPAGNTITPFNPLELVKSAGTNSVFDAIDKDIKWLTETIKTAIQHKWFSHIRVNQACPTWKNW